MLHIVLQGADIMLRLPYDAELVLIDADLLLQQLTLPLLPGFTCFLQNHLKNKKQTDRNGCNN